MLFLEKIMPSSCGSVVEHCVSSTKGCGFNSPGTRILIKIIIIYSLSKSQASAKCINVMFLSIKGKKKNLF